MTAFPLVLGPLLYNEFLLILHFSPCYTKQLMEWAVSGFTKGKIKVMFKMYFRSLKSKYGITKYYGQKPKLLGGGGPMRFCKLPKFITLLFCMASLRQLNCIPLKFAWFTSLRYIIKKILDNKIENILKYVV